MSFVFFFENVKNWLGRLMLNGEKRGWPNSYH